jgi:hypothetical protein
MSSSTSDLSGILPLPKINFPCNFNPNPGFTPDCIGVTNPNATVSTSNNTSGPMVATIGDKVYATLPGNITCLYDPSKEPLPLLCKDKYCDYYYKTNLINTSGFNPPLSHTPDKIVCRLTNNICTYDPTISQQLICDNLQCRYHYNNPNLLLNLDFNPPYSHQPDETECNPYTPSDYRPPYVANYTRVPPVSPSNSIPPSETEEVILPSVLKSFTLYNYSLPITIPSTLTTEKTKSGNPPDPAVKNFWIQSPYVPSPTYSDLYPDPNPANRGQPYPWTGFKQALSKCIELDGSTYAPSSNICGTPSATNKCINPLLAYPNIKPKCYAVSTQSDLTGNRKTLHSLNYNLVEEPDSSPRTSLSDFNKDVYTSTGNKWIERNKIDKNYLFCQTQFYTWIKNTPSGEPYNTNDSCKPVVCPRGPIICPPSTTTPTSSRSSSSRSSSSSSQSLQNNKCVPCTPVTCPIGSPAPNFNIVSCPRPVYSQDIPYVPPDNSHLFILPPSFYEKPTIKLKPKYVAPVKASTPITTYIIGGVVVGIVLVFLYFTYGPGAEVDVILPLDNTITSKLSKKLGGYFYYD